MELPNLLLLLICTNFCLASHHTHVIPVEGYETELQNLGEHVEIPETPIKVVKITKTVAVKVPVPYPVKIVEKVPYPVHVNKPYPVPVPQIIKVPVSQHLHGQEALDVGHVQFQDRQNDGSSYQVQENPHDTQEGYYNEPANQRYESENQGNNDSAPNNEGYSVIGSPGSYYGQPQNFEGSAGDLDGHHSFESRSYDLAIQNYLNNLKPNGNFPNQAGYH